MSSWWPGTPYFPPYSGPHEVGTVDVEIPSSDLPSPSFTPDNAPATISFRIFYPCNKPLDAARPVRWIPQPQRQTVSAFAQFLGAGSRLAELFAIFPRMLYYIQIPAHRNAALRAPSTASKRWPVMFFSHGLAGSRNMYSHICGSIASHGTVVIALDHRDGSSPVQYIRATSDTKEETIYAKKLSHTPSKEVYEGRDHQLRIRLWEVALAHIAMVRIDKGWTVNNLDLNTSSSKKVRVEVLSNFQDALDIHDAGKIAWCGHSFGAATMCQLLKTVYYNKDRPEDASRPLFNPERESQISRQITNKSPLALLDLWAFPLQSPDQDWLLKQPLPCYSSDLGGRAVVTIMSEAFSKWSGNMNDVKRAVAPPADSRSPEPSLFYPVKSQHFSQSDFGILFPWITQRFAKAEEPERVLKLNTRAVLQMLRNCNIEVSATSRADREIVSEEDIIEKYDDAAILSTTSEIRGWVPISIGKSKIENPSTKDGKEDMPEEFRSPTGAASVSSEQASAA